MPDETQVPALRGLLLENGETVNVLGGGYIGRAPRSPDEDADAQLVAVPDPERSLSRTHARFGLVGGDLWLEDLGSANGTTVQMADGRQAHLTPHQRVALPVGTVVPGHRDRRERPHQLSPQRRLPAEQLPVSV